jgi:uncharacterized membrane protein
MLGYLMPFFSKETLLFGVRISNAEKSNPELERIKNNYKHVYLAVMIPFLIIISFTLYSFYNELIKILSIILQVLVIANLYAQFNLRVKKVKRSFVKSDVVEEEQVVVVDDKLDQGKYLVSKLWFVPAIVVILLNLLLIGVNYKKIPVLIPSHIDITGKAIQFVYKSHLNVFFIPFLSIFNLFVFCGIYFIIKKSKQETVGINIQKTILQDRHFKYLWSGYLVLLNFVLSIYFTIISLHIDRLFILPNELFSIINIVLPNLILTSAILLVIKTGQSGSRLKVKSKEIVINFDPSDDDYWKYGLFYYNPDDPAIFIEKKIGIGWTLNFGHPISFVLLIAVLAIPVIIAIFSH